MEVGEIDVRLVKKEVVKSEMATCIDSAIKTIKHHCFKIEERNPEGLKKLADNFAMMAGFEHIYGSKEVQKDIVKLANQQNNFYTLDSREGRDPYAEKAGNKLELLIKRKAEKYQWFGKGTRVVETGLYADWFENTDMVLVFDKGVDEQGQPQRLALVVDATIDSHIDINLHKNTLIRKINHNSILVGDGERNRVKYFKDGDYMGQVECVPVVVGLTGVDLGKMDKEYKNLFFENQKNSYYADHPIQMAFLFEIEMQLQMYEKILARKKGENFVNLLNDVNRTKKIVEGILEEKKADKKIWGKEGREVKNYLSRDKTFVGIYDICKK